MESTKLFEIRDTDINTEEICERIRKSLEKKTGSDTYPVNPEFLEKNKIPQKMDKIQTGGDVQRDFYYINTWWDLDNSGYQIKSHHRYLGKILVQGREIVNGEVRRYVDPILTRQSEFNSSTTRILNEYLNQINSLNDQVRIQNMWIQQQEQQINAIRDHMRADFIQIRENIKDDKEKSVSELKNEITVKIQKDFDTERILLQSFIESLVQQKIKNAMLGLESDIRSKIWFEKILTDSISNQIKKIHVNSDIDNSQSQDYFQFNEVIGKAWIKESGVSSDFSNVFEDATNLFASCHNVLDIGCGEGYFLSLLKSKNIGSYGIDINQNSILYCKRQGLNVFTADAITHLASIDDESLDGIFISQLIEHLNQNSIVSLLTNCYRKMKKGSSMVVITPNILSVQVSSNLFYMDPSHKTHVHPEVLKYILHSCGFSEIQEKFYNNVPADHKLHTINEGEIEENSRRLCHLFNYNIELLNQILFGYRDYAAIVKK